MICKKAHVDCLEEVKQELSVKHVIFNLERMLKRIEKYNEISKHDTSTLGMMRKISYLKTIWVMKYGICEKDVKVSFI
jgi:hypothetical protein